MPNPTAAADAATANATAADVAAERRDDRLTTFEGSSWAAVRMRERSSAGGGGPFDEGERGRCLPEPGEVGRAPVAVGQVLLEALALGGVEHVECVEGGKLVEVVGHIDSNPYSPGWPGRFGYSNGSFWTLCAVAYSSVSVFTTSMPSP